MAENGLGNSQLAVTGLPRKEYHRRLAHRVAFVVRTKQHLNSRDESIAFELHIFSSGLAVSAEDACVGVELEWTYEPIEP